MFGASWLSKGGFEPNGVLRLILVCLGVASHAAWSLGTSLESGVPPYAPPVGLHPYLALARPLALCTEHADCGDRGRRPDSCAGLTLSQGPLPIPWRPVSPPGARLLPQNNSPALAVPREIRISPHAPKMRT